MFSETDYYTSPSEHPPPGKERISYLTYTFPQYYYYTVCQALIQPTLTDLAWCLEYPMLLVALIHFQFLSPKLP